MFCAERLQSGGAGRDRTGDLLNANQALSQLSYSPWFGIRDFWVSGLAKPLWPITNHQSPTPNFVIEADWTLPAGARPNRQNKSQNSKWRSETDLDWKGCYLLTAERLAYAQRLGFRRFGNSSHFLS